jgi:hypothetical protein
LTEAVVSMGLMGLAGTLMMGYLIFFARLNLRYQSVQETLSFSEKALNTVMSELSWSRSESIRRDATIAGIVIPRACKVESSALQFDSSGVPIWSSWRAFGVNSGNLWSAEQAFVTPVTSGGELTTGPPQAPSNWRRRVLLRNVKAFEVSGPSNRAYRVRLFTTTSNGYQVEFVASVVPQN